MAPANTVVEPHVVEDFILEQYPRTPPVRRRVFGVPPERRVLAVAAERRIARVPHERRIFAVPMEIP